MTNNLPEWAIRVLDEMEKLNINPYQLHTLIKAPYSTVSSWFNPSDKKKPVQYPRKYIDKLAETLHCSVSWILTGDKKYNPTIKDELKAAFEKASTYTPKTIETIIKMVYALDDSEKRAKIRLVKR